MAPSLWHGRGLAWSRDAGATFQFIRGRDWRTKAEQMIEPLSAEKIEAAAKAAPAEQLLLEDYVTCLAQDERQYLGGPPPAGV